VTAPPTRWCPCSRDEHSIFCFSRFAPVACLGYDVEAWYIAAGYTHWSWRDVSNTRARHAFVGNANHHRHGPKLALPTLTGYVWHHHHHHHHHYPAAAPPPALAKPCKGGGSGGCSMDGNVRIAGWLCMRRMHSGCIPCCAACLLRAILESAVLTARLNLPNRCAYRRWVSKQQHHVE
jgi:hypothetical protein